MNIAILGGRFDPPHWGHYWVARQLLHKDLDINQVWLMPVNIHPWKWKKTEASAQQRLEMVKFLEEESVKACSLEIERGGISYTVETIKILKKEYKEDSFYWTVGSDAISDFSNWRQAQKLSRLIPFLVFPRVGYPVKLLPKGMKKINNDEIISTNLSSTFLRRQLKNGLSIKGFVPSQIEEYIKGERLYQ